MRLNPQVSAMLAAVGSCLIWSIMPIYYKQLPLEIAALEVVMHRVVWSSLLLLFAVGISGKLREIVSVCRQPRMLCGLGLATLCIGSNWLVFFWAIPNGQMMQSSLGLYTVPLINVLLGAVLLGERLRPLQWTAVSVAAVGVLVAIVSYGYVPWIGLYLAVSFSIYALIRRQLAVGSLTGLLVESVLALPIALAVLGFLYLQGTFGFGRFGIQIDLMMVGVAVLSVAPMLLYIIASKRLRYATLGLITYITPTGHLLVALYYGESLSHGSLITFVCIWLGLLIYGFDLWRGQQRSRMLQPQSDTERVSI